MSDLQEKARELQRYLVPDLRRGRNSDLWIYSGQNLVAKIMPGAGSGALAALVVLLPDLLKRVAEQPQAHSPAPAQAECDRYAVEQAVRQRTIEQCAKMVDNAVMPEAFRKASMYTDFEAGGDNYLKMMAASIRALKGGSQHG